MPYHKFVQNFNAGELSPFLSNRTDVAKYESGCQELSNFIILPYGGVMRRPGTQYIGKAKFTDKQCRLIGFNFSVTTNFVLEFGHQYIRFWTNGQQVMTPGNPTVPLEVATGYVESQLRQIQYCQINDLMYLVHPDHGPAKLTRNANDNWSFSGIPFKWPPVLTENSANIVITPSNTGGNIVCTASAGIFNPGHVGSTWQIGHNMAGASQTWVEVVLGVTTATSPAIRVRGPWSLTTYGSWSGEIRIHRTIYRTGVAEYIRTYHNSVVGERNIATTGNEDEDCSLYIYFISAGAAGNSSPLARLEFSAQKVYGLVQMYYYQDPQVMHGTVTWGLAQTAATPYWSEPAFSGVQGYPRAVCLHEQRLVFGGTRMKPLGLHASQLDDFEDFQQGALADNAIFYIISANESNPINWMVTQTKMLLGTAGNEWSIGPADSTLAIGPGNVQVKQQSSFGSSYLQAKVVNEVVLFTQRQGKKVRELVYSFEKDGWVAPDLNVLASHISGRGGFVETAFAQQPDSIFWAVTSEGKLAGMTYERDQNVVGWHNHFTDGSIESVATIYGGTKADEVWVSVKRECATTLSPYWATATAYTVGQFVSVSNEPYAGPHTDAVPGRTTYKCLVAHTSTNFGNDFTAEKWVQEDIPLAPVRYIERLDPNFRETLEDENKNNWWYLDSGYRVSNESKVTEITGLGHLEGRVVGILGDGANQPTRTVVGGKIILQEPAKLVLVGLPYDSIVRPMNLNIPVQDTTQGRKVRIHKMVARVYKSLCCKFSSDGKRWDEIFFRDRDDKMDSSPSVFTGDREVHTGANFNTQQAMSIKQDRPFPLCVLAMIYWADSYGE